MCERYEYLGDLQKPQYHWMESRQWLILIAGERAHVEGDVLIPYRAAFVFGWAH
jgi:hypothetical protein